MHTMSASSAACHSGEAWSARAWHRMELHVGHGRAGQRQGWVQHEQPATCKEDSLKPPSGCHSWVLTVRWQCTGECASQYAQVKQATTNSKPCARLHGY